MSDKIKFRGFVLHTVGVRGDTTMATIREHHVKVNGWKEEGYHFGIRKNGAVEVGRALTKPGAHLQGANDTVGICVYGDGDREPWTPEQTAAVLALIRGLASGGVAPLVVIGHREGPAKFGANPTPKSCPGRLIDMGSIRRALGAE